MARTTAAKVNAILKTSVTSTTVDEFIAGATEIVDEVLGSDTTISDSLKAEIERWLTAHMIASTIQRMPAEAGGGPAPRIRFTGRWDKGLDSTPYGQQVKVLDSTGKMASLSGKAATIRAVASFDE